MGKKKVRLEGLANLVNVTDDGTAETDPILDGRVSIRLKRDRPNVWGDVIKAGESFTGSMSNGRVRFDYYPCESLILDTSDSEFLDYFEIVGPVKPVKPANSDDYSGPTEGYVVSVSRGSPVTGGQFESGDGGTWQEYYAKYDARYVERRVSWNIKGGYTSSWVYKLKNSSGGTNWYPTNGIVLDIFGTESDAMAFVDECPKTRMFFNAHSGRGSSDGDDSGEGFRDTTMWGT